MVYSNALTATGGLTPYSWSITSGALPAGLSLNGVAGAIYGVPLASGTNEFGLRVTGADNLWSAITGRLVVQAAPPPVVGGLGSPPGMGASGFGFNLSGLPGQMVVVEGSTNLRDWMALQTNIMGAAPYGFSDSKSTNLPSRFYRARLP